MCLLLFNFLVAAPCINNPVSAKETDKSTAPLNNSKHSAIHSSCQLLKPPTALLIRVLWLYPVGCVLSDQNQMNSIAEKHISHFKLAHKKNIPMSLKAYIPVQLPLSKLMWTMCYFF